MRSPYLVIAAIAVAAMAACSGPAATTVDDAEAQQSPVTTTSAASASADGPLTGAELVWLEGIGALHKTMDDILQDSPTALTPKAMGALAKQLGGCSAALNKLGPPTDRLRPVSDLAGQGCAEYQKAGTCFETAAKLGVVIAGSDQEKKQNDAISCGFAKPGDGSKFLAGGKARASKSRKARPDHARSARRCSSNSAADSTHAAFSAPSRSSTGVEMIDHGVAHGPR